MLSYINERNVERMIDAKNAEITRKINGDYTLSFIAIDEPDLLEELIVICEGQKYRIKQLSSTMSGNKTLQSVTCKHISFDLIDYYAYDYLTNTVTLDKALQFLFKDTPFTYSISGSIKNQSFEKLGECNKQKLLAKIIEAYGLEYEVDNYHFTFKKKVGYETEFQFRYKANISNVKKDIDTTSLTTYIKGYGKKDDEGNYLCTAEYTSPNAEKFGVRHADPVFDERFTIKSELLEYIKTKINDTPDIVVELDYTQIDSTQPINLGDYGYLIHEPLQLDLLSRVIEITKKLSTDRQGNNYQNMTYKIGSQKLVKSSFETSKDSITGNLETPKVEVPDVIIPDVDYDRIQAEIEAGKQEATDKINSGLGGYVTKTRNELLIMDTEDKATARNLWRWNINGLGFSSNGYSGPYATAITNDGKINADRILVGTIDGALIRANTIKANSLEISTVQKINAAITADDATAIMNTRLEVYDGNIKTHISTVAESKKTEAINSANQNTTSAINSAKTELNQNINTAKSDLTSKINLKANASDVYGKSEVYTKTQTDSAIKQSKDNISLEVSNKYETKTDAAAKITNLSIGGVNLYLNTKIINRSDWANIGNWNTSETYNEFTVFSRTGAWMGLYQNIRYEVGQTYTLSAYVKGTNGAKLHFYLNGSGSTIATSFNGGDTVSDSWTRVWATFRVNGSDFGKPRFENPTDGATLKIYGFKLEKGNKATDWSPAPEDVDSLIDTAAINAINSANQNTATVIANYYTKSETDSKISVAKDEINLGVSNKYETKANVETKVTSTLNSAKSYADTKKTEAINSAATDATSKVNAAKSELNTAIGKKANTVDVYSKAEVYTKGQTDSAIKVAKDEINLGVSNTYETKANVETKITAIEIGGKNLLRNSDNGYLNNLSVYRPSSDLVASNVDGWRRFEFTTQLNNEIVHDKWYTPVSTGDYTFSIICRSDATNITSNISIYTSEGHLHNPAKVTRIGENLFKIVSTFTRSNTNSIRIVDLQNFKTTGATYVEFRYPQLEKGVKSTDWSPSIEDTAADINNAKNEAISSASTDAANKANNAKNEAINSANATLTSTIANYYTKAETDSAISVAKDAVTTSVSNLRSEVMSATYTNLLENSDFLILDSGFPRGYSRYTTDSNTSVSMSGWTLDGGKAVRITSAGQTDNVWIAMFSPFVKAYKGETFTASVFITTNDYTAIDNQVAVEIEWHSDSGRIGTSAHFFTKTYNGWERQSVTGTAPDGTTKARIRVHVVKNGTIYVTKMMLQTGGILTNWVKGGNIDSVTERLASAEQKITDESITNTVKKNFYTKEETNNAITSKGYVTQSQLQQTANNITSTVSQNYYTKQETENTINNKNFATKSEVQQTANDVTFKFSQSGGYNLVRNGNPKPWHEENWWVSSNAWWYRWNANDLGIQTNDANESYAGSATFKVNSGSNYSFSCWIFAEGNTKGTDIYFVGSSNDDGAYEDIQHLFHGGKDGWTKVEATFTTGSNTKYGFIRIDNNGIIDASAGYNVVFFSEVQLVQGWECYPQWSPNPNEIYDGITTIDKDGVKVVHGDSYSRLGAHGLMRYDGDVGKYYHYLSYMGQVDLASEERVTIQLPPEFRNRDFKVIVSVKRVRMNYDPYAEKHLLMGFYAEVNSINTSSATFEVYASVRAIKSTSFNGTITGADYGHDIVRPVVAYWVYA